MSALPFADQLAAIPESDERRHTSAKRFLELGLPTPRNERWKYTNLAFLQSRAFDNKPETLPVPAPLVDDSYQIVFTNGHLDMVRSTMNLPDGVHCGNLGQARGLQGPEATFPFLDAAPLVHLNNALMENGLGLLVSSDQTIKRPIEICFLGSGSAAAHTRMLLSVGKNSSVKIIERHVSENSWTSNLVTEIIADDNSQVIHARLNQGSVDSVSLATGVVTLRKNARYEAFALTVGGQLSRHEVTAILEQPGSHLELNGAHILNGDSHADTTTEIRHLAPHCASRETYRHVMDGTSRSVFQGKIHVAQDAQKTDGFQLNQSLMLSPQAEVNAKPELEIYADDVKCSHGATSGRLDEDALFYLRSRGLPEASARAMLVDAFIGSVIDLISDESVREAFRAVATAALHKELTNAE